MRHSIHHIDGYKLIINGLIMHSNNGWWKFFVTGTQHPLNRSRRWLLLLRYSMICVVASPFLMAWWKFGSFAPIRWPLLDQSLHCCDQVNHLMQLSVGTVQASFRYRYLQVQCTLYKQRIKVALLKGIKNKPLVSWAVVPWSNNYVKLINE